nr:SLS2 [Gentiana crassicaulis]
MELELIKKALVASCLALVLGWVWRILDWAWFTPKKIEKHLREQGFNGNPYRLLVGDVNENAEMLKEAMSKPMPFNNDVFPRVMPHIHHTIQKYGKKSFTWMGRIPRVNILEPELVKEMLFNHGKFQKNFELHNPLVMLLLSGIGSLEGDKWAKHRKIISPAFTLEKLKTMLPSFAVCYNDLLSKWEKTAAKDGSIEVDIFPTFDVLTSDVISKVAFGSTYEEGNKVFLLLKEMMDLTIDSMRSVYIPGWCYVPTKKNNRLKACNKVITDMMRNIINKRMKAITAGEPGEDDLLGVLLDSNVQEIRKSGNKKNVGMTIDEVIDECKLFYFAGQETTGVLLTWSSILLSKHPEWQERAREEVLQTFGKNKPDFDRLNHLKYVNMILYETLRLYPPVVDLTKVCHKDTKLGPYTIPGGTQVIALSLMLHRDKTIWGEDALEFNPGRFAEGVANATKNQTAFLSFSAGPRVCLGQNFALLQAKLGLTMLLQRFSWDLSPSYTHAPFTVLTMQPQFGSHVIYKKLQ